MKLIRTWKVPSSQGDGRIWEIETHTTSANRFVKLKRNGILTCTCPPWTPDMECPHIYYLRQIGEIAEGVIGHSQLRIISERRSWTVENVSIPTGGYEEYFRVEENNGEFICTCLADQSKGGCAHVRKVVCGLRRYPVEESTVSKRRIRVTN